MSKIKTVKNISRKMKESLKSYNTVGTKSVPKISTKLKKYKTKTPKMS